MLLLIALTFSHLLQPDSIRENSPNNHTNKIIPAAIEKTALVALSHYPELEETSIRFVFTSKLKRTVMAARPITGTLFKSRNKRGYEILINPAFKLGHHNDPRQHIPDSVMIGWLAHELGHIMDYETRSTWNLIGFGLSYWLSRPFIQSAEYRADSFAMNHGLGEYIIATKSFILNHPELPQIYKDRIANLYPSPDDIVEWVADISDEHSIRDDDREPTEEEGLMEGAEASHAEIAF
ncbi:hypothetical protein ACFOET_03410 [Parapedobacter deserti]|uniref:Uncharacterized protein n=1 Tax=Parapedobacter deserti TaxID=1912957 RepID=A0ABV7JHA2_9SPHI